MNQAGLGAASKADRLSEEGLGSIPTFSAKIERVIWLVGNSHLDLSGVRWFESSMIHQNLTTD